MKRITAILLLCSFAVLCGCSSENETESRNTTIYDPSFYGDYGDSNQMQLNHNRFYTRSYDEYLDYVKNTDYIEYDGVVSQAGEFYYFRDDTWEDEVGYAYEVKDKEGIIVTLTFHHEEFNPYNNKPLKYVSNGYDMRTTTTTEGRLFYYKDLRYRYVSADNGSALASIDIVISDDLYVNISLYKQKEQKEYIKIQDYPLTNDTFLGRLLNIETAVETVESFKAAIKKQAKYEVQE